MAEEPAPIRAQVTDDDRGLVWTADGASPLPKRRTRARRTISRAESALCPNEIRIRPVPIALHRARPLTFTP